MGRLIVPDNLVQTATVTLGTDQTTTSAVYADLPGMSITFTAQGGFLSGSMSMTANNSAAPGRIQAAVLLDGVILETGGQSGDGGSLPTGGLPMSIAIEIPKTALTPGSHTVKVQWQRQTTGTGQCRGASATNGEGCTLYIQETWV